MATTRIKRKDKVGVLKPPVPNKPDYPCPNVFSGKGYTEIQAGENTDIVQMSIETMVLPALNLRECSVEDLLERVSAYYNICGKYDYKPTITGLAIAIGISRKTLWAIVNDKPLGGNGNMCTLPRPITDALKRVHSSFEQMWETYMLHGKINPVSGIFIGKNNYGYVDKIEYSVESGAEKLEYNAKEIAERYEK